MQAVKGDLLKEPRALMGALATGVWGNCAPGATAQLMLLLSLFEDCLNPLVRNPSAMHCPVDTFLALLRSNGGYVRC